MDEESRDIQLKGWIISSPTFKQDRKSIPFLSFNILAKEKNADKHCIYLCKSYYPPDETIGFILRITLGSNLFVEGDSFDYVYFGKDYIGVNVLSIRLIDEKNNSLISKHIIKNYKKYEKEQK